MTPFEALKLALKEARRGAGFVAPNPLVGCTILDRNFNLLSVGYHTKVGQWHAEREALEKITDHSLLEGAHVFVTLEPCAHEGRTPSCAKTLAPLPIASVTYGLQDPFPLVSGQGAEILRAAGKRVLCLAESNARAVSEFFGGRFEIRPDELADLQWQMEEVSEIFLHNVRAQLPFVALKVATSLDGQMALQSGESKWITGSRARDYVHRLRAHYDAILVGSRTWKVDNPSLDIRHDEFPGHRNRVVLIDPDARMLEKLESSKAWATHAPDEIFLVVAEGTPQPHLPFREQNWIAVPRLGTGALDLREAMRKLFAHRVTSVLVEGGAETLSSFIRQGLAQRLYLFQAPFLMGARAGLAWTSQLGIDSLNQKIELHHQHIEPFAPDWMITARFK